MHHMRLHDGKRHLILCEYICHGELAAESVAAVGEIHLADLVRICLHEDRNARILQCRDCSVFVREDRHGKYHAIERTLVLFQPFRI